MADAALRFKLPIRCTMLLPTASTAPRGAMSVGPAAAVSCTRKSLIAVPFQTPTVPLATCISDVKMNPQSRDSYHPNDTGDHSKRWTRIGDGSIPCTSAERMVWRIDGDVADSDEALSWGESS